MVNFAPTFERTKELFHSAQYDFNAMVISQRCLTPKHQKSYQPLLHSLWVKDLNYIRDRIFLINKKMNEDGKYPWKTLSKV